jgi:hypothetical protein
MSFGGRGRTEGICPAGAGQTVAVYGGSFPNWGRRWVPVTRASVVIEGAEGICPAGTGRTGRPPPAR